MELKDYTIEQLKAEIKRKNLLKIEEQKRVLRCRNCKYCEPNPNVPDWCRNYYYVCTIRTWGKKVIRNYTVRLSDKACEKFENKNI